MPGGNFDNQLQITGGKLSPQGPLDALLGVAATAAPELYIGVVQHMPGGTSASMHAEGQPAPNGKWVTVQGTAKHVGQFVPGKALGWAVEITKSPSGGLNATWWTEEIDLT